MKLIWFRRDLRIDDNPALDKAIEDARLTQEPLVALYTATPKQWGEHHMAPMQADLIHRRLGELRGDLEGLGVPLFYSEVPMFEDSAKLLINLVDTNGITGIYFNKDYEVDELHRDSTLTKALSNHAYHIDVEAFDSKCVFTPGTILNQQGSYFKVFTPFKKAWLNRFSTSPAHPVTVPFTVPMFEGALIGDGVAKFNDSSEFTYPKKNSQRWPVSSLEIDNALREFCESRIGEYGDNRDFPAIDGTSNLSAYLAIGALSPRRCIEAASLGNDIEMSSSGIQIWISELIWREFYQHLIHFEPRLVKHENFLVWGNRLQWRQNEDWFEAWCSGNTGYPIVDAAMKQLNATGWMHNRLRMVVASFLVKDLQIDWRKGERYFMSQLVDGDFAANNGGWQWCASTGCDGQPYFRIFNPISQGERFDAEGDFVRQWLPELESVPNKFIHNPWKWEAFDSIDYPHPIVDHKEQRAITLDLFKRAKDS